MYILFFLCFKKLKLSPENFSYLSYFCSKQRLWVHVEPHRDGSNEYPQSMLWSKNKKIGIPLHTKVFIYKSGV